jgi:3-oxoadipate enol-lactonase
VSLGARDRGLVKIPGRPALAVEHRGGAGELCLLLHGVGGNRRNWRHQLAALSGEHVVVAWDARGYGDSDDYDGPFDFSDTSHDIVRVLDHFGREAAHLIGLSMGGLIAAEFHERHPDRVLSLTICSVQTGVPDLSPEDRRAFLARREAPLLAGLSPREIAPAVARSLAGPHITPGALEELVESLSMLRAESYLKALRHVAEHRTSAFANIRVPTHFVAAADDPLIPLADIRELASRCPGSRLTIIPDAGHVSNIERPDAFNAAVLEFLRSIRSAAATGGAAAGNPS